MYFIFGIMFNTRGINYRKTFRELQFIIFVNLFLQKCITTTLTWCVKCWLLCKNIETSSINKEVSLLLICIYER
jgi:hypothetical protein